MNEALVVSHLVLWALVVVLALVVLALARQIGVLHERIAPVGALAHSRGPEVGDVVPEAFWPGLAGERVRLGGTDDAGRRTLLFFLSPACPVCKTLLPTLERVAAAESPAVRVVYASDGAAAEHTAFAALHGLAPSDYALSETLGLRFSVSKLPFAVLLDASGRIRARGLVNTREHVESLFEADRLDAPSLQAYLARGARAGEREVAQ